MDMVAERAASKSVELALLIEEGDINVSNSSSRLVVYIAHHVEYFAGLWRSHSIATDHCQPPLECCQVYLERRDYRNCVVNIDRAS